MCLSLRYFPLVELNDGKRKLMLNYGIKVENRESMLDIRNMASEWRKAPYSNIESINRLKKRDDVKDFVKMVSIPCGHCRECMNAYSREWAFKICCEAEEYPNSSYFVTLTYNDEHLPSNHMLIKDEISKFNKKLRTYLDRNNLNSNFRFYGVGEYGTEGARPHYHVIYFNLDIPDLKFEYRTRQGNSIFSSKFLDNVWGKGFVTIGGVSIASACYVARYCQKKKRLTSTERNELIKKGVVPEFSVMSRKPGIGSNYFDVMLNDFTNGIYKHYIDGKSYSIPNRFLKKIKSLVDTDDLEIYENYSSIKSAVKLNSLLDISDKTDLTQCLMSTDNIITLRKI